MFFQPCCAHSSSISASQACGALAAFWLFPVAQGLQHAASGASDLRSERTCMLPGASRDLASADAGAVHLAATGGRCLPPPGYMPGPAQCLTRGSLCTVPSMFSSFSKTALETRSLTPAMLGCTASSFFSLQAVRTPVAWGCTSQQHIKLVFSTCWTHQTGALVAHIALKPGVTG